MNKRNLFKALCLSIGGFCLMRRRANAALSIGTSGTLCIYRSADGSSITSQTTLQSDSVLTLPVAASVAYYVEAFVPFNLAGIVSGYKIGISLPSSPTNVRLIGEAVNAQTGVLALAGVATAAGNIVAGALATSGDHYARVAGTVENGANAGNLVIQAAQNTSDGSAIKILRGAFLRLTPLQ